MGHFIHSKRYIKCFVVSISGSYLDSKGNSGATIVKLVFIQDESRGGGDSDTKSCRTGDINGGSVCSRGTSCDIMEIILGQ